MQAVQRVSSLSDLRLLAELLRAGGANIERNIVSLRRARLAPCYRQAMARFPALRVEYFNKLPFDSQLLAPTPADTPRFPGTTPIGMKTRKDFDSI